MSVTMDGDWEKIIFMWPVVLMQD